MLTQDNETVNETNSKYIKKMTPEDLARELARLRSYARHNEAAALRHARDEGRAEIIAEELEKRQKLIAEKEALIAEKDAEIARLREQLEKKNQQSGYDTK